MLVVGLLFALVMFAVVVVVAASPAWVMGLVLGLKRGPSLWWLFSIHPVAGALRWLMLFGGGMTALTFVGTLGNSGVGEFMLAAAGSLVCGGGSLVAAFGIGRAQGSNARARRALVDAGLAR